VETVGPHGQFHGGAHLTPLQGRRGAYQRLSTSPFGGMLKSSPDAARGVPAIVKPATRTCQVTEGLVFRDRFQSAFCQDWRDQLVTGGLAIFGHLDCQMWSLYRDSRNGPENCAATLCGRTLCPGFAS